VSLTREQFARAAALEADQLRLQKLQRLSCGQLHALLAGDPAHALAWVRSAAQCGVQAAQLRLGRMLLEGQGLARNEFSAFRWFKCAASRGDPEALNMLGRCHENGWGVPVDLQLAANHYKSSADAGHDWGQYNLGNLYFDGRGVTRDLRQAFCWYLRSASQGHARAMNLLARCLEEGWGCSPKPADAADWYRCSAQAGYFRGQFNHAIELTRRGQYARAAQWFWSAAKLGDANMRQTIIIALAQSRDPALTQINERVRELVQSESGT
jgi:TPR repeat protein